MLDSFLSIKPKSGQINVSGSEVKSYVIDEKAQKKVLKDNKINKKNIEKLSFNISFPKSLK